MNALRFVLVQARIKILSLLAAIAVVVVPHSAHSRCQENIVYATVKSVPAVLSDSDVNLLFDGSRTYSGNPDLRFDNPASAGQNALIVNLNQSFVSGATLTVYFEVDDAAGQDVEDLVEALEDAGYGAWYWDRNGDGQLGENDFDIDGDEEIGPGDYSPVGFVVELYLGDPGDPVGSGPGTLVDRQFSPIQAADQVAHSFTISAPAEFTHFTIESIPVDLGADPRVIEVEVNGIPNSGGQLVVLRPWCSMQCNCS
ncbi:MAG: hypothetical protein AB3N20_14470 [Rhizobiaceae bacterium]